jgi:hypothetical protein
MLDKLKFKAKAGYKFLKDNLSRNSITKSYQYIKFCDTHEYKIELYYKYFMKNYIKILKYLSKDFKQKTLYDVDSNDPDYSCPIKEEIENIKQSKHDCESRKSKFTERKLLSNKYLFIKCIISEYPIVLKQLKKVAKSNNYKDIDIKKEYETLGLIQHLNYDVKSITNSISKDVNGNNNIKPGK